MCGNRFARRGRTYRDRGPQLAPQVCWVRFLPEVSSEVAGISETFGGALDTDAELAKMWLAAARACRWRLSADQETDLALGLQVAAEVGDVEIGVAAGVAIKFALDTIPIGLFHTWRARHSFNCKCCARRTEGHEGRVYFWAVAGWKSISGQ